jgi:ribosomal protein L12E/L44/L45/RPP1/RPP2
VRALVAAGADVHAKQQIVCKGGGFPHVQEPYDGPPFDHTPLMVVATSRDQCNTAKTGPAGCDMLKALLASGVDANERNNEGTLVRELPSVSPEAKEVLDAAAAAAAAAAAPAAAPPAAAGWSCCGASPADTK